MSEALQNSSFLTGIKKINNNSKFVITISWIISNNIKNEMFSSHRYYFPQGKVSYSILLSVWTHIILKITSTLIIYGE